MGDAEKNVLLKVEDLSIGFSQYLKGTHKRIIRPIANMHVEIGEGEIVAVVGASGSGKACWLTPCWGYCPGMRSAAGKCCIEGKN